MKKIQPLVFALFGVFLFAGCGQLAAIEQQKSSQAVSSKVVSLDTLNETTELQLPAKARPLGAHFGQDIQNKEFFTRIDAKMATDSDAQTLKKHFDEKYKNVPLRYITAIDPDGKPLVGVIARYDGSDKKLIARLVTIYHLEIGGVLSPAYAYIEENSKLGTAILWADNGVLKSQTF